MHTQCGTTPLPDGSVRWTVWAPNAERVDLQLIDETGRRTRAMTRHEHGYVIHTEPNVSECQRYAFSLDGGSDRADPASRWQPEGVGGPSAVVFPNSFRWT